MSKTADKPTLRGPSTTPTLTPGLPADDGMTLRDWFAGQALAGFCAGGIDLIDNKGLSLPELLADYAYGAADAMLEAREEADDE